MRVVSQLSIFLENRPGAFARVCAEFAKRGVNMQAVMVEDAVDHAVIRMVVDKVKKAKDILEDHGAISMENEILAVDMSNRPGEFVKVAQKLAKAMINMDYAYGSAPAGAKGKVTLFVRVPDPNA
ncbi:MAG: ACT domain-containing protein, partial [Deltaproteobacteria bacterium]|nr:ACT domain-containing protein [Deltaproteobacteria bacterium]